MLRPDVAKSLPCWLSQFSWTKLIQPTGQRHSNVRTQHFFHIMRKVWYHQIWIQSYLGFIVLILNCTYLYKILQMRHQEKWRSKYLELLCWIYATFLDIFTACFFFKSCCQFHVVPKSCAFLPLRISECEAWDKLTIERQL